MDPDLEVYYYLSEPGHRGAPDKDKYFKLRRLRMGLGNAPERLVKLRSKYSKETKLPMELSNAPERFKKLRSKCFNETKLPMKLGNGPERFA
ncbi:hypothetical protein QQP08_021938 [Theobroma cacao]|nr:hypothetical protein QQP08_021938 [Theobroma cacao]